MSEATAQNPQTDKKPKKSRKSLIIMLIVVLLLAGGGGGGFFYLRSSGANAKSPEKAKKVRVKDDEESDDEAKPSKKSKENNLDLPDDSAVKQVIELQPFVVNLADKNEARYLRLTVSIGLGAAKDGEKPDPLFTTRARNAMLAVLTAKTSDDVLTAEGKAKLRKELLKAAQSAIEEPHIEAIYITDFIVQL
jgi:flagellar FliL protein